MYLYAQWILCIPLPQQTTIYPRVCGEQEQTNQEQRTKNKDESKFIVSVVLCLLWNECTYRVRLCPADTLRVCWPFVVQDR